MKQLTAVCFLVVIVIVLAFVTRASRENEYYKAFMDLPENYRHVDGARVIQGGEGRREPEYLKTRMQLVNKYAWAVPNRAAIKALKECSPNGLVDFGAGGGYWAKLLSEAGVSVSAIDNWTDQKPNLWFPVEQGSYELLPQHKRKTLLLCWPPRASNMAVHAIHIWEGDTLAYIGEPAPARGTANPAFFAEIEKNWILLRIVEIPSWYNRNDNLFIYKRQKT